MRLTRSRVPLKPGDPAAVLLLLYVAVINVSTPLLGCLDAMIFASMHGDPAGVTLGHVCTHTKVKLGAEGSRWMRNATSGYWRRGLIRLLQWLWLWLWLLLRSFNV